MNKFISLLFFSLIIGNSAFCQFNFENPRVAIIISKSSFTHHWGVTQMSAHGWGGVANLAGVPYDCISAEDLSEDMNLKKYDCLIFTQCTYLSDAVYESTVKALENYLSEGGNLIIDGLIGYFDEKTKERDHSKLNQLLDIKYIGFYGDPDYRIKVKDNDQFITKNYLKGDFVTQHIAGGLNVQTFENDGRILLELTNEKETYPFLSVRQTSKNRIVLINDFATWSSVPSFFRNVQPQVFYKNQIYNLLIESVYWSLYDSFEDPIPSLQVSNADLTAIIRLDADASGNLNAQIQTINYLIDIANETGVVPVYAWVSSTAATAGWQDIAPLGKKLENVGGQIGTHSKFHNIDQNMNEQRWKEELDDAIKEIEFNMMDYGYGIGKVDCFINPGNTIHMSDYNQIAKRFGFYMTHGFEQDMPIGFGNFTWFNEDQKNFVVLENTPSPDYQWFYDPTWSYTTQQITAYEESIFDHLYDNIKRGVIFNQMWHDYSITSQPQYGQDRIINTNNIAMYDAIKTKFKNNNIYCPEPEDLRYKICIMAQSNYSWSADGNQLNFKFDISNLGLDSANLYTGGMGIRINNSSKKIDKVFINNIEHFAFNDNLVILPNISGSIADLKIILADESNVEPHLTYISKPVTKLEKNEDGLILNVLTKSKAKFSFNAPEGYLLLNADGFNYSGINPNEICGYTNTDRSVRLKKIKSNKFSLLSSTINISDISETENEITLKLKSTAADSYQMNFNTPQGISRIFFDNTEVALQSIGNKYSIVLGPFDGEKDLTIKLK
ncbi:MAG TPA: hypothetical protein VF870_03555 [Ignavibacteriaceae bacterium]